MSGGLPLQLPNGIGLLGMIAARRMNGDFTALMRETAFSKLGMTHSFIGVLRNQRHTYAQGYTAVEVPIRMKTSSVAPEAYGITATCGDMLRFIGANMGLPDLDATLRRDHRHAHRVLSGRCDDAGSGLGAVSGPGAIAGPAAG